MAVLVLRHIAVIRQCEDHLIVTVTCQGAEYLRAHKLIWHMMVFKKVRLWSRRNDDHF